jgi:hypothetical protein
MSGDGQMMKFNEFWTLYLRAHSLPGTRAMHYFATVIGAMSVTEAVVARQPLFLGGIALGYGMAIGAHKFIEGNHPLIRVNAAWGAIADLRMCWLAANGRLAGEMAAETVGAHQPRVFSDSNQGDEIAGRTIVPKLIRYVRFAMLVVSVLGLMAGLSDLDDLFETDAGLHYAFVQLGAPIAAFAAALMLGMAATITRHPSKLRENRWLNDQPVPISSIEISLWRACVALVVFGVLAMATAEIVEHGFSNSTQLYAAFGVVTVSTAIASVLLLNAGRDWNPQSAGIQLKPGMTIVLRQRIGYVGGPLIAGSGVLVLGWQGLDWMITANWHPLPLGAVLRHLEITPAATSWTMVNRFIDLTLAAPSSITLMVIGTLLLVSAFDATMRESQRRSELLFRNYLHEAQTGDRQPRQQ